MILKCKILNVRLNPKEEPCILKLSEFILIYLRKRLFARTVSANKNLFAGLLVFPFCQTPLQLANPTQLQLV